MVVIYGGKLKSMPAKLLSDDGDNIIIRPLAYCAETNIKTYVKQKHFPIIPCGRVKTIFTSIQNIVPSYLLDPAMFDFKFLSKTQAHQSPGKCAWLTGVQDSEYC